MNKKIPVSLVVAVILVAMTVTFSMTMVISQRIFNQNVTALQEKSAMFEKLAKIDTTIRTNFYGQFKDDTIFNTTAAGYIAGLGDKDSKYYTAEQYVTLTDRRSGKLMGIGVNVEKDTGSGYGRVVDVYNDTPASEAGIVVGDLITKIGEIDVKPLASSEVINNSLYDVDGGTTDITYVVNSTGEEKTVSLIRRAYTVPTVASEIINNIGYIEISDFTTATPVEFDSQLQSLLSNNVAALVFDIRDNQSTNLESVARILDILLPQGALINSEYKQDTINNVYSTSVLYNSDARQIELPMVCITNQNTAYGAEIFAADLLEYHKAKIVGTKTAGKGSIQKEFIQSDGSAVVLTIAKMLTKSGNHISDVGVEPNFISELNEQQLSIAYSYTTSTDPQIIRALDVAANLIKGTTTEINLTATPAPSAQPTDDPATDDQADESTNEQTDEE